MTGIGRLGEIVNRKGPNIWSVPPDSTVFEAIQFMADKNVGALLVMSGDRLLGVVSERDYTRKVALKGKSSRETSGREILTSPMITASPEEPTQATRLATHQ